MSSSKLSIASLAIAVLAAGCVKPPARPASAGNADSPGPSSGPASDAGPAPASAARHAPLPEGAYRARIDWVSPPPTSAKVDAMIEITAKVTNLSMFTFPTSHDGADARGAVFLAYHVYPATGAEAVVYDGLRSELGGDLPAGGAREVILKIRAPGKPGKYRIVADLVHEGVTWFSEQNRTAVKEITVTIER